LVGQLVADGLAAGEGRAQRSAAATGILPLDLRGQAVTPACLAFNGPLTEAAAETDRVGPADVLDGETASVQPAHPSLLRAGRAEGAGIGAHDQGVFLLRDRVDAEVERPGQFDQPP